MRNLLHKLPRQYFPCNWPETVKFICPAAINCLCLLIAVFLVAGCGSNDSGKKSEKNTIFVSIAPEKFLVDQIVGDSANVEVLVPPGREPHDYSPTARQIAQLGNAKVLFTIGVPFEEVLVPKLREMFPDLKIVDISRGVARRDFSDGCHDCEHEHSHSDPHVWMSPKNMQLMAKNVTDELAVISPEKKTDYQAALEGLDQKLALTIKNISAMLKPFRGRVFYVFHPTMGYFADEFGLTQKAIEVDGKEPTAKQLSDLISHARADDVHVIFVQPQFPKRAARSVAQAIDGRVESIDPLSEDYLTNINKIADTIAQALGAKK